jgi:hypothetical protein
MMDKWTVGFMYDTQAGRCAYWLDSLGDIYSCDTGEKSATFTRDGKLCDINGKFTGYYLGDLRPNDGAAFAEFKKLAKPSA